MYTFYYLGSVFCVALDVEQNKLVVTGDEYETQKHRNRRSTVRIYWLVSICGYIAKRQQCVTLRFCDLFDHFCYAVQVQWVLIITCIINFSKTMFSLFKPDINKNSTGIPYCSLA